MTADVELFLKLIEGLKSETAHYRRLFELGEEQKEILVAGDLQRLSGNVRLSEKEMFALGPLASSRTELLTQINRSLAFKDITLTLVAEQAPESIRASFQEAVAEVVKAARKLDEVNRANEKLLENAMSYVSFTLDALSDGGKTKNGFPPATLRSAAQSAPPASMLNRVV